MHWPAFAPYFAASENWGPKPVEWVLVYVLWQVRDTLKRITLDWPIIVHDATGPGHSATGYHPKGLAVDFHFATATPSREIVAVLLLALRALHLDKLVGIGVYVDDWTYYGRPILGLHLDCRGYPARWGRIAGRYVTWEEVMKTIGLEEVL